MNKKPFILISNDDGIKAPGIKHLWNCLHEKYDSAIAAPHREKSGMGLATTMLKPLHVFEVPWEKSTPAWKITGTPTDAVKLALSVLLKRVPDMVVSGINKGSNAGQSVLYSGTVACTIEATLKGIPGIAFSCFELYNPPYEIAEKYIPKIVEYFLNNPIPKGTLINVTFPKRALGIKGIKLTHQGLDRWIEDLEPRSHPEGHNYYWLRGKLQSFEDASKMTDTHLLDQGYITVCPIQVQNLTDHNYYLIHKEKFDQTFQ